MNRKYLRRMVVFALLFVLSILTIFLTYYFNEDLTFPQQGAGGVVRPPDGEGGLGQALPVILSIMTASASMGGFVVSTFFAFRQDRRARELHRLELVRLEKELAQRELEIERLRRRQQQEEIP